MFFALSRGIMSSVGKSAPLPPGNDPFWNNVALLMHMDGTNGSTTFLDQKGNTQSTVINSTISTAQSKFGGASGAFGLNNSNSVVVMTPASNFNIAANEPFTIEAWVYPVLSGSWRAVVGLGNSTSGFTLYTQGQTATRPAFQPGGGGTTINHHQSLSINTWNHLAATRDSGGTLRIFLNGVVGTTTTVFTNAITCNALTVGGSTNGGQEPANGYIDDLRITKGIARYTASFIPPTSAFPDS